MSQAFQAPSALHKKADIVKMPIMDRKQWHLVVRFMFWTIYRLNRTGYSGSGSKKLENDLLDEMKYYEEYEEIIRKDNEAKQKEHKDD